MYKKCKVVILDTKQVNNNGQLFFKESTKELVYSETSISNGSDSPNYKAKHLYILSNDEIKEGDWFYSKLSNQIFKEKQIKGKHTNQNYQKIIATTDSSLKLLEEDVSGSNGDPIFKPLPQIPQLFIEQFIDKYNTDQLIKEIIVKVNLDNSINIRSLKDSYSRKEVIKLCLKAYNITPNRETMLDDFKKWANENI